MAWTKGQAKEFAKQAKERAGINGWDLVGQELQEALLAREFVYVTTNQTRPSIKSDDLCQLWEDMCDAARGA